MVLLRLQIILIACWTSWNLKILETQQPKVSTDYFEMWRNITIKENSKSFRKTNIISFPRESDLRSGGNTPCVKKTLGVDIVCHKKVELGPSGIQDKLRNQENRRMFSHKPRKLNSKVGSSVILTPPPRPPPAWEAPVLVTSPLTLKVQVGREVFLPCFVSRLGECLPTWQHAGRVLSVGEFLVKKDRRLRVTAYYGLVISGVVPMDKGPYLCQVDYQGYVQEVQHMLVVLEPPIVKKQPNHLVLTVEEGDPLTMRCAASGYPNPVITWWKEGSMVQLGQGLSLRMDMTREMEGIYVCSAENGVGQASNKTFDVRVQYPPKVSLHLNTSVVPGLEGLEAIFSCTVEANPAPTISWMRDNMLVANITAGTRAVVEELRVQPVDSSGFGNYECVANNSVGMNSAAAEFSGSPLPPIVTSKSISSSPTQYNVSWSTFSISSILEYQLRYKNKWNKLSSIERQTEWKVSIMVTSSPSTTTSPYKHSYLIHSLAMDSAYQLEIRARNSYGWSRLSKLHTIFTIKGVTEPSQIISEVPSSHKNRFLVVIISCIASVEF